MIDTAIWDAPWPADLPIPASQVGAPPLREAMQKAGTRFYPADRLAEDALRGLEKNKAILAIPGDARRLWLLARLSPNLVIRQMIKATAANRRAVPPHR